MKEFIFEKPMALSDDICHQFIRYFDLQPDNKKQPANDSTMKNNGKFLQLTTTDEISIILNKVLIECLSEYKTQVNDISDFSSLFDRLLIDNYYIIKYDSNDVDTSYHFDNISVNNNNCYRLLNFIWCLNNCDGEIELIGKYKINFEKGKFILFPTEWFFPYNHTISSNKYIIKGWIFLDNSYK